MKYKPPTAEEINSKFREQIINEHPNCNDDELDELIKDKWKLAKERIEHMRQISRRMNL